jgi:hypothetical protein
MYVHIYIDRQLELMQEKFKDRIRYRVDVMYMYVCMYIHTYIDNAGKIQRTHEIRYDRCYHCRWYCCILYVYVYIHM